MTESMDAGRRAGSRSVSLVLGVAVGLTVSMLFFDQLEAWRNRSVSPVASAIGIGLVIALLLVSALRRRDALEAALALSLVPTTAGTLVQRIVEPDPMWAAWVRAGGVMLVLVVALVYALSYARQIRELDRVLFTEATSVAFFFTVVGATAYAGVQAILDMPRISFAWISLFGLAAWATAAFFLRKRYS